jgi:hypothetical protein
MKKTIASAFIFLLAALVISCSSGTARRMNGQAGISFADTLIDFGQMEFRGDGQREFVFTSTGDAPLVLARVKSTCGCTVPEWSKEPVPPGETGRIRVDYDTRRIGRFRKSVYVYSNAAEGPRRLYISGEVLRPPDSSID